VENKIEILSAEVIRLKKTEGSANAVCEVMERYEKMAAAEAVKNTNVQKIIRMIEMKCTKEFILSVGYTEEEFSEAEKKMLEMV